MPRISLLLLVMILGMQATVTIASPPESLTEEELSWLEAHPQIRLGIDPDWAPFEYRDERLLYSGMAADYIALVSQKLGLTMQAVPGLSWSEVLVAAQNRELDILPAAMATPQREEYLKFTDAYLDFPMVIITRANAPFIGGLNALEGHKVAVVKNYVSHELLETNHSYLTLSPMPTIRDSLSALSTGEIDAFVGNLASASHAINQLGLTNLKVAAHTPYSFKLGMGVRKDWPELTTILDKTLKSLSAEERRTIQQKWILLQSEPGIDLTKVAIVVGPIILSAGVILLVVLRSNRKLRGEISERLKAENKLKMSEEALVDSQAITHIGNYVWEIEPNITLWSDELYRIVGRDAENFEPSYEGYLSCIHPEDRDRFISLTSTVLDQKAPYSAEYRIVRPSGQVRNVFEKGKIYRDESGKPIRLVGVIHDISERKESERLLEQQAYFDGLTGLPNRNYFMDQLSKTLAYSHRHDHLSALLFFDFDNFKIINDTLGHHTGDKLLSEAGKRISHVIRKEDTAARLGGDEFVIIASNLGKDHDQAANQARHIAEKIQDTLSMPFQIEGHEHHITLSIGISLFPVGEEDIHDIVKFADTAMYRAKESGRDTIRFFQPSMQQAAEERFELQTRLHHAVEQDELELYFQPQYSYEGEILGAECLLRWYQPDIGMVSPARFIPLAEESGMILEIGRWVLRQACKQIAEWTKQGLDIKTLAVNVSPHQFNQADFASEVLAIIKESGIDPSKLELELTEGVLVENITETTAKISQLREQGIHFAIDDFGTGYSSLLYLQQLPLDRLKIDQSFVRDIQHNEANALIVETIISMAHHFDMELIAEGVEAEDELKFLDIRGCHKFQGYYFSKPLNLNDFNKLLLQP